MDGDAFESHRVLGAIDSQINLFIDQHEKKKRLQTMTKLDPAVPPAEPPPAEHHL